MNRPTFALVLALCLLLLAAAPAAAQDAAQGAVPDSVTKTVCASTFGYAGLEPLKDDLLLRAKREASNELFGELIAAATRVENLVVTSDQIRAQSLGLIRVRGSVLYANGPNLAEVCATITAFATAEDRAQFTAEVISGRACINEALTLRDLRAKTETAARIKALTDYDSRLQDFAAETILPLLRRIDYNESGVLPGTETYCATVVGAVIPIEVKSFLTVGDAPAADAAAFTGAMTPTLRPTPSVRTTPSPAATRSPTATPTPAPARTLSAAQATATAAQATVEAYQSRTPTPTPTHTATPDRTATAVVVTAQAIATAEARAAAALAATAQAIATADAWAAASASTRAAVMATAAAANQTFYDVRVNPVDGAVYVYVPAGEFTMGSATGRNDERPAHTVYLDAFWIMRSEVTNAQYRRCVDAGVCTAPDNNRWQEARYADHPVTNVNWAQAAAYAKWVGGALPTEAQWEKACRGDDRRTYPWGNATPTATLLNFNRNVNTTTAVGSYLAGASPYGALDMAGNVWEWTADWYAAGYYAESPARNPSGPSSGSYRVLRGGSYGTIDPGYVRCAYRSWGSVPISRLDYGGFRVVSPGF